MIFHHVVNAVLNDAFSIVSSLIALSIFMVIAEMWRYFLEAKVEWTRKFVHFCSGVLVSTFPWFLQSIFSVVIIALLMLVVLLVTKKFGLLNSVHSVCRKSYGDVFYLAAVIALFLICRDEPHYYFAAILTLAIADALAAIIGSTYHTITFSVEANQKSLEGSAIFFLATFLTIHLPLLLLSNLPKEMTVLIALQIAIVVTLIEAIAINGFDNLAIPVSVYFLLIKLDDKTVSFLSLQILVQIALIAAVIIFFLRYKYFSLSALIVSHLLLFAAYSLCGPSWLVPPVLAMIAFARLRRHHDEKHPEQSLCHYQLMSAAYVCFAPVLIIFTNNFLTTFFKMQGRLIDDEIFFGLYAGAVSASVSLSMVTLRSGFKRNGGKFSEQARVLFGTTLFSFLLIVPASLVVSQHASSIAHWTLSALFAFGGPFSHLILWHRKHEHELSYIAYTAVSLGVSMVLSSSLLIVFAL